MSISELSDVDLSKWIWKHWPTDGPLQTHYDMVNDPAMTELLESKMLETGTLIVHKKYVRLDRWDNDRPTIIVEHYPNPVKVSRLKAEVFALANGWIEKREKEQS